MVNRLLILVMLTAIAGCGGKSNLEPPTELEKFTAAAKLTKVWSRKIGASADEKYLRLTPSLDDNVIFAAGINGKVSAFATDSGRRLWRTKLKQPVSGAVGYSDSLVLVGTPQGKVIALDKETGQRKWEISVSSEILSSPVGNAGVVVVQTNDGKIFGLSEDDGKHLWMQQQSEPSLSLRGTSQPVITRGAVISGFSNGKIGAFVLKDGRVLWEIPVSYPRGRSEIERVVDVDVSPLFIADTLYAANYQGKVLSIDIRDGHVSWSKNISTYSGIAADDTNLYLTDERGFVHAFDLRTGSTVWTQEKLRGR